LELDTLIDLVKSYIWNKRTRKCPLAEPQLVHRLDRDTSGVILLSKDMHTLRALHDSLRRGAIHKHYRAICHSSPPQRSATIETALARSYERGAGTRVMVAEKGLPSRTSYTVLRTRNHLSDLRLDLHTGRTHQIRVQLAHIGCPIAGDTRYGSPELDQRIFTRTAAAQRLYLHAERLSFPHPATKETIVVAAPIPREFEILMQQAARRE
jgi:23S rRNA pseudouridine955/2504/2580 synthase